MTVVDPILYEPALTLVKPLSVWLYISSPPVVLAFILTTSCAEEYCVAYHLLFCRYTPYCEFVDVPPIPITPENVELPVLVIAPESIVPAKVALPEELIEKFSEEPLALVLFADPPVNTLKAPLFVLSLIEPLLSVHIWSA